MTSVSSEARDAAITALATYMAYQPGDTSEVEDWKEDAEGFVDALIAHGWEPKRTVSRREVKRHIYHAKTAVGPGKDDFDAVVGAAVGAVMVAGIEVTE